MGLGEDSSLPRGERLYLLIIFLEISEFLLLISIGFEALVFCSSSILSIVDEVSLKSSVSNSMLPLEGVR